MARRDSRSPSPAGSYSSRRSRRDDDRSQRDRRRDEPRPPRRRSRSPGVDRRERDRDYHNRDYDRRGDRRDDGDHYRSARRDRSRDRLRSPDRLARDRRERSRDRDNRNRRDDSRERHKRRRDDSTDSKNKRKRDDSRDARDQRLADTRSRETSKPTTPTVVSEEDKKAERLAKLEAWKQKQTAEREKKQKELEAAGGTRNLLNEMDRKAAEASASASPQSPRTPQEPSSPVPYAGKFDPKNIAKKAAANATAAAALGADAPVPKNIKTSSAPVPLLSGSRANRPNGVSPLGSTGKPNLQGPPLSHFPANYTAKAQSKASTSLKASKNVGGFGLGQKVQADAEKPGSKPGIDFGEEESTRKKLEKLPTPPPEALTNGDATLANADMAEDDDDDEDADMQNADTEEEAAAAARVAAEKREERLLAQSQAESSNRNEALNGAEANEDVAMTNADEENGQEANEEEEPDPLDAFMSGLDTTTVDAPGLGARKPKSKKQEADVFENEDNELDAMDINADDFLGEAASKIRKKKDIPTINHAKMNYEPFRRNFYSEPTELADMTEQELGDLRLELDGIKVRGVDVPKPVQKWSQCGLGAASLEVVRKMGFEAPTAIQSQALPAIMSGRDVIGIAKTGSGKTIAFLLPMFRHIKDQRPLDALDGPVGLIMTPTRELATQIHKECKPWLKALNLRAVCAYGGAPIKDQIADLKRGAEIIVCTPGRMIDLLAANSGRVTNLRRVTYIVLDEADRMFDMGFEPQVMKIMANIRPQRQTVLFSATFPRNMEALARKTLTKPVEIIVGGRSVVAPEIKQIVEVRPENTKFLRLLQLLGDTHEDEDARSLIFVDRQESAEELMNAILRKGYPCFTIHGGKDQYDRDSVISDFKAGIFPVLVATSVAARGLDVKQLKMVVNFDCPNHLEDYVHRAGRTGRAGNTGLAVTFITEEQDRYSIDIAKALRQSGQEVPEALQKLVDSFMEKVKAGKEKASASGFGGKGLERLDQERDAAKARERKTHRTGDEGDEEDKDKEDETTELKKDNEAIVVQATNASPGPTPAPAAAPQLPTLPAGIDLDGKVTVHKREDTAAAGESAAGAAEKTQRVNDAVAAINARLRKGGELRGNAPIDNKGPDAGAFHSTFEINDLPQKARWAVTNRTNVAKILDATGTSITTKGNFYPQGQTPGPNDMPKLYILVEGDTELVVTQAISELRRLAKDGMVAALNSEARAPASGRYSVV